MREKLARNILEWAVGEDTEWSLADQQIAIFKEWGDEDCPHYPANNERKLFKSIPKRMCDKCWKSLEAKDE